MALGKTCGKAPERMRGRTKSRRQSATARRQSGRSGIDVPEIENHEIEIVIERLAHHGDGVGHWRSKPVYVPMTAPGDRVRIRIGARSGDGLIGTPIELLSPGPKRIEPPCPHFGSCGGCRFQHLEPDTTAEWKRDRVVDALRRVDLAPVTVDPPVTSPPASRRRAVFAARRVGRHTIVGFNEHRSHRIVDIADCPVSQPEIAALLSPLRGLLGTLLTPGGRADIAVSLLDDGLDVVLIGTPEPDLTARQRLAAFADTQDLARLSWQQAPGRPAEPIAYRRAGRVRLGETPVVVPPGGFLQATREGEAALSAFVVEAIGRAEPVADLFAGAGTFALPLARDRRVLAVDGDPEAIAALSQAGRQAGPGARLETCVRDLHRDPMTRDELSRFTAVVFDPPRAGARDQAKALSRSQVACIVAVSCNPSTVARDVRILADGGYTLERILPVDQFVWSPHVELAAVLRR